MSYSNQMLTDSMNYNRESYFNCFQIDSMFGQMSVRLIELLSY